MLSLPVSDNPLTSFRIQENGRMAAVGARDGSTAILQLADSLVEMQPNEKQSLTSVISTLLNAPPPPLLAR